MRELVVIMVVVAKRRQIRGNLCTEFVSDESQEGDCSKCVHKEAHGSGAIVSCVVKDLEDGAGG